jgi:hypothetical protein
MGYVQRALFLPLTPTALWYLCHIMTLLKQEGDERQDRNVILYLPESESPDSSPGSKWALTWPGDLRQVSTWPLQALEASLCASEEKVQGSSPASPRLGKCDPKPQSPHAGHNLHSHCQSPVSQFPLISCDVKWITNILPDSLHWD